MDGCAGGGAAGRAAGRMDGWMVEIIIYTSVVIYGVFLILSYIFLKVNFRLVAVVSQIALSTPLDCNHCVFLY